MYFMMRWKELLIGENDKELFPYLKKLDEVSNSLDIPITGLFWDENELGCKPDKYAIYYITSEQDDLSSDDDTESGYIGITVSFYIRTDFRKTKLAALKELRAAGFFATPGYETYERDTHYKHFDVELKYYM